MSRHGVGSVRFAVIMSLCASVYTLACAPVQADDALRGPDDGAYLDAPYTHLIHPLPSEPLAHESGRLSEREVVRRVPVRSNIEQMLKVQSGVRSQGARGTCSIFSATAMLEALLISTGSYSPSGADLSEEWLEHAIMANNFSGQDGSTSPANFNMLIRMGSPEEALLPYLGEVWSSASTGIAALRCGKLAAIDLTRCLLGHRNPRLLGASDDMLRLQGGPLYDPEYLAARENARDLRDRFLRGATHQTIYRVDDVKRLLAAGVPVTLDIDFYYGAWNHRVADSLNIGRSDAEWAQGLVTYPAAGTVDLARSNEKRAGHSVHVIGYDDDVVVRTRKLMTDGTTQEFSYRGVYYFKNSWGMSGFGVSFAHAGRNYPGYGMITQAYANEHGAFFGMTLRRR